jgi:hypothetical protein
MLSLFHFPSFSIIHIHIITYLTPLPYVFFFSLSLQPPSISLSRRLVGEAVVVNSSPFLHYVVISWTFQEGHGAYMGRACGKGIQRGYGVIIEARISA